jgi:hypothetical protein
MSILDDISMGLGFKEKDDAYHERTAATIERTQGSSAADRYRDRNPPAIGFKFGLRFYGIA